MFVRGRFKYSAVLVRKYYYEFLETGVFRSLLISQSLFPFWLNSYYTHFRVVCTHTHTLCVSLSSYFCFNIEQIYICFLETHWARNRLLNWVRQRFDSWFVVLKRKTCVVSDWNTTEKLKKGIKKSTALINHKSERKRKVKTIQNFWLVQPNSNSLSLTILKKCIFRFIIITHTIIIIVAS